MQRAKQIFLLLTCLILVLSLSGCDQSAQLAALDGTWYTVRTANEETTAAVLQSIDLYEPELELIDNPTLQYCQTAQFRSDWTYTFTCDAAASKPFYQAFFREVFQQLYEGRAALSKLYWEDFESMSQDAFFEFYAALYMEEDFDALLDRFSSDLMANQGLAIEEGTFTLRGEEIFCTPTEGKVKAIRYQTDENGGLLLTYENGTELYTHDLPTL